MHLARKLSYIFALLGGAVLAGQIVFELNHEMQSQSEDARTDHRLLGRALAGSVTAAWAQGGRDQALELLEQSNRFQTQVTVRWVWIDVRDPKALPRVSVEQLSKLIETGYLAYDLEEEGGQPLLVSYVPVDAGGRHGAIEITEPVLSRGQVALRAVRSVAVSGLLLGVIYFVAAMLIGRRLIGRPVQALMSLSQQLGVGNLKARSFLERADELGQLGIAMNKMAIGLEEANARIAAETTAKLVAQESVRHADRLTTVGKLAAGVAHELGTPLNVVDGRARMIAGGDVNGPAVTESARIISEQVSAMVRIIRQLLDFARRRAPKRAREPLQPLVARTLELLHPLAARRNVKLVAEVEVELEAPIDSGAIGQVLTNLVMNAIQAMERSGEVRVRAEVEQRAPPPHMPGAARAWIRLDVEDDGPGIAPEVRPHIFEPFFTTKGVGEGTGLGLSVSYGIVQDHGGWIAIDPAHAGGTRFCIYLPCEAA